ncbi:hypothetical protein [Marinicellulosiphila megalodicopiae]|uniref:hypothetical protein n=1 Tax=Marinicellulosiphila megalodicopiae TaxID=2724896 RepID=UPI003BAF154F
MTFPKLNLIYVVGALIAFLCWYIAKTVPIFIAGTWIICIFLLFGCPWFLLLRREYKKEMEQKYKQYILEKRSKLPKNKSWAEYQKAEKRKHLD